MKIYALDGKLKYTYSREYDGKTDDLMRQYETMHTDEGTNQNVFDLGEQGFASVLPLRDGKQRTYEVDFYSSLSKNNGPMYPMMTRKNMHRQSSWVVQIASSFWKW